MSRECVSDEGEDRGEDWDGESDCLAEGVADGLLGTSEWSESRDLRILTWLLAREANFVCF